MDRRQALGALGVSVMSAAASGANAAMKETSYLELKVWRLHNTHENQTARVSEYLDSGLAPALQKAGARLAGAFSTVIGPDSPTLISLTHYGSLAAMGEALGALANDAQHTSALEKLGSGSGLPFVRVESSLLKTFDVMPEPAITAVGGSGRVFELRTYESQSFATLVKKVGMFNSGEAKIFERLGFRPVFFGQTVVGPSQPNLKYMLSYDDLAARDKLWGAFLTDPEWKKLSSQPDLKDAEIVANITNVILAPLPFSAIR